MKTAELTGASLDYWVAKAEGKNCFLNLLKSACYVTYNIGGFEGNEVYSPSTDWSQGGPIIEREKIEVSDAGPFWSASMTPGDGLEFHQLGDTYLQAAMRCFVASKYGDGVPDEGQE
jgi:hypothetical protein